MNNEPVAWMHKESGQVFAGMGSPIKPDDFIPLYTHPAKTLTDEIEDLKNELMMEEESYMLLNESFLFAKESIKQQQAEIEALKALNKSMKVRTLNDEEISQIVYDTQSRMQAEIEALKYEKSSGVYDLAKTLSGRCLRHPMVVAIMFYTIGYFVGKS